MLSGLDSLCWPRSHYSGQLCAKGHHGPMCSICEDGYLFAEVQGHCIACPPSSEEEGMQLIYAVIGTLAVVLALMKVYRRRITRCLLAAFPFIFAIQKQVARHRTKLKIALTYFQIISQYLGGIIHVRWPSGYKKIAQNFDVL